MLRHELLENKPRYGLQKKLSLNSDFKTFFHKLFPLQLMAKKRKVSDSKNET